MRAIPQPNWTAVATIAAMLLSPLAAGAQTAVLPGYQLPGGNGSPSFVPYGPGTPLPTSPAGIKAGISTTLTTPAGTTYTGASMSNPLAICASSSTDCTPLTVTISAAKVNSGWITGLVLQKSTTATGAQFRVNAFESPPTLTGVQDGSPYSGPAADELSRAAIGTFLCTAPTANQMTFECTSERSRGFNAFQVTNGTLYFVISATAPYVRPAGETFTLLPDLSVAVP